MKIRNISARIYTIDGKQLLPGSTLVIDDRHADNPGLKATFGSELEIIKAAKDSPAANSKELKENE